MKRLLRHSLKVLKRAFPGNWQVRHRLLTAGFALSVLALAMPVYMRAHLNSLSRIYGSAFRTWESLGRIHDLSSNLTESEDRLRAYAEDHDERWIAPLEASVLRMNAMLENLREMGTTPERLAILRDLDDSYSHWQRRCLIAVAASKTGARIRPPTALEITEAARTHQLLDRLARSVHGDTTIADSQLWMKSHETLVTVTYGGIVFFCGFITLMLSLWYTIIPGLGILMDAARELKRGRLDHRVHITGASEMSHLGRAFNEMAVSLQAQNEKLKELNRVKSDFVSTVSHELRTPLTAIKGSIGLILGGVTGEIPDEARNLLDITQKNTDRLIRLINEVLDIAKIEAGAIKMRFDKHSLVETIEHALQGLEPVARSRGIALVWERPELSPLVVLDRDRIEQVLTNLLSNAIKFTAKGGKITVRETAEADRVVVEVEDNGEGIPDEFIDRIFQKFHQAESAAHKAKEGTGLGLAIARAIIEEHGGSIWLQSKLGVGSRFFFSLPWNGVDYVEPPRGQAA